jgi:hypothetical protein
LPAISEAAVSAYSSTYLSPNVFLKSLVLNLPQVKSQVCESVENFRASEDGYQKPAACQGGAQ